MNGQKPVKEYRINDYDTLTYKAYSHKKTIPENIKPQVLIALSHFPELKDVAIIFKEKKSKTPLTSKPKLLHVFKSSLKRTYVITISTESIEVLNPILFKNLPFNAQVGVIGHELSHIADYINQSSLQMIGIALGQLKSSYVDNFEYQTDYRTIAHNLGYQLYDWSVYVRENLNLEQWRGLDPTKNIKPQPERYMNPETILSIINASTLKE